MHLTNLQQQIYDRLGFDATTTEARVVRRLLGYINQCQREILGKRGFERLRRRVLPFAYTANHEFTVLPQAMSAVYQVVSRANYQPLQPVSIADIRLSNPSVQNLGNPQRYVVFDLNAPVADDPSVAAQLFVVSTAAGDTTQTAYIEGIVTGGYQRTASVVLTGTTPVTLASAITTWIQVTKFYISAAAVGTVTLTEGSGGTVLSTLAIGDTYARYTRLMLDPIPAAGGTLFADGLLRITDMANAQDEPMFDDDWHWLLVCGALREEALKRKDYVAHNEEKQRFERGIASLRSFVLSGNEPSRGRPIELSQLGPWFPANT